MKHLEQVDVDTLIEKDFNQKLMRTMWIKNITDEKKFHDIIYALLHHYNNRNNAKFYKKLHKTSRIVNLDSQYFIPFLLKYLIIFYAEKMLSNKHIESVAQALMNDKKLKINNSQEQKNKFILDYEKKELINRYIDEVGFFDENINYIDIIDTLNSRIN